MTLYRLCRASRLDGEERARVLEELSARHHDEATVVVLTTPDGALAFRFVVVEPEAHAAPVNGAAPAAPVPAGPVPAAPAAPAAPEPAEDRWDVLVRRYSREFDRTVGGIL